MPRAILDLSTLSASQGFVIAGDMTRDEAGFSVSAAGDINNDGIDDIIIGVPEGDNAALNAGEAHVIFGKTGTRTTIDLGSLAAADGFTIEGEASQDSAGTSVSFAGDINNDGIDDIIVGADNNDSGGNDSGEAYVVFGKTGGPGDIDLSALAAAEGFSIRGDDSRDFLGDSVSSVGDFNGDGIDDVVIGARGAGVGGGPFGTDFPGRAYVVFGANGGPGNIDISTLTIGQGFTILGAAAGDQAGIAVSQAGDFNGDGRADILVSSRDNDDGGTSAGKVHVIFGKSTGIGDIDLANLALADGISIQGANAFDTLGSDISGVGDVNGDGRDDIIVGASRNSDAGVSAGAAYVIYGKSTGLANIDVTSLTLADGFQILGDSSSDFAGTSVGGAGDVNGDGLADLIVGAPLGDDGGSSAGEAYVIYGKNGTRPTVDLTTFDASEGFVIQGDIAGDDTGQSVSGAGDVNGDGVDDLIVGAIQDSASPDGPGRAYVIYGVSAGGNVINGTPGNDPMLFGTAGVDTINGLAGDDILAGFGADDFLNGGDGADLLIGGDGADAMDGGAGFDTAFYGNSSAIIVDLTTNTGLGGEATGDTFVSVENIRGSNFIDNITGDALANALIGQDGNDLLEGMAAGDALLGGAGSDTASYISSTDTVAVNIGNGTGAGAHAAGDVLVGIENLSGSEFGDLLRGGGTTANNPDTDNSLFGNGGGDLMLGDEGNDTLFGGAGGDIMTGGTGNDEFLFDNFSADQDIITDFDQSGNDTLRFLGFGPGFDFADFQLFTVNGNDVFLIATGWQGGVVLQNAVGLVDAGDFVFS